MSGYPDIVRLATPLFVVLIVAEMIAVKRGAAGHYFWKDSAVSLSLGLGSTVAGALAATMLAGIMAAVHTVRIGDIPVAWWSIAALILLDDLAYYLFHRSAHRVRWFWAAHVIHHSSRHYNLTTALRQTWTGVFALSFVFRLPLVFAGFPVDLVLLVAAINLVYEFWIHTEVIGRMPAWFEAVMNTPSHHRVHHATNPRYLDRNFAGMLIIWDRMFGTFQAERADDRPRYGIIRNLRGHNPLWAAVHEWLGIGRDLARARSVRAVLGHATGPPGWRADQPDGSSSDTADAIRARWQAAAGNSGNG
jgi:sterol desaturase/sphingolipid hydroxylase (fatty acid hydroxylase superfamily)